MSLNPKIAIVTGASGGIGEKIALALAKEYGELIVTGRNAEALARLKSQIQSASPSTVVRAVISD
jgi:short-subunit dehydrogenase